MAASNYAYKSKLRYFNEKENEKPKKEKLGKSEEMLLWFKNSIYLELYI